ncbi:MAG: hypothetical protein C0418_00495 [Coriobacteriaceae bacterium]|nr:hypothetical protein [Coriobacteriaceae bacterium]
MSATPDLKVALVALNAPGHQSLALGYVRAYAEQAPRLAGRVGFMTLDLDSDMDPWWVAYRILRLEPDVLGMSVKCWNAQHIYQVCSIVKRTSPGIHIVLGGPEVSPMAEQILETHPYVDTIVRGEGEETFAELLGAMLHGGRLWYVDGVTTRRDDGVVSAPARPLIADLDSIPSPYASGLLGAHGDLTYIETYRGCPRSCAYCYEGKGYDRIRYFSQERVAAEIEAIAGSGRARSLSFIDPVFNLTRERLEWLGDVLEPWARQGVRLHTIEVDIERIGTEEAALLRRAGVVSVETGPQTVSATTLERCNRRFDRERFSAGVEACKQAGIAVECDLIVGLPGDTADDLAAGLDYLLSLDPGKVQLSSLNVLPGTPLWERAEEYGIVCNPEPPHEVMCTATMGFTELRRAEAFGATVAAHYGARSPSGR